MLTQARLKELFHYCPKSGLLTWSCNKGRRYLKGKVAGSKKTNKCGKSYIKLGIDGSCYLAHRVIWIFIHGEEPMEIDHINGNGIDNRILNLRNVTPTQNQRNKRRPATNKTGVPGVDYLKNRNKWQARINNNLRRVSLGYFTDWFEAVCARKSAEVKYNYHHNHGMDRPL